MRKYFLIILTLTLTFVACKKNETKLSNLEMLTAHKWKYSAMTQNNGVETIDIFTNDNCETDDVYEFKTNMEVVLSTGAKSCYQGQESSVSTSYSFNETQDTLLIDGYVPICIKIIESDRMEWDAKVFKGISWVTNSFVLIKE